MNIDINKVVAIKIYSEVKFSIMEKNISSGISNENILLFYFHIQLCIKQKIFQNFSLNLIDSLICSLVTQWLHYLTVIPLMHVIHLQSWKTDQGLVL